jgi:hypothetical protein
LSSWPRNAGTFQEIADEAFGDLLKKYNRPTTLKGALRESVKHPEMGMASTNPWRRSPHWRHQKAHLAQE